jgi:hypothetical protein
MTEEAVEGREVGAWVVPWLPGAAAWRVTVQWVAGARWARVAVPMFGLRSPGAGGVDAAAMGA